MSWTLLNRPGFAFSLVSFFFYSLKKNSCFFPSAFRLRFHSNNENKKHTKKHKKKGFGLVQLAVLLTFALPLSYPPFHPPHSLSASPKHTTLYKGIQKKNDKPDSFFKNKVLLRLLFFSFEFLHHTKRRHFYYIAMLWRLTFPTSLSDTLCSPPSAYSQQK